MLDLARFHEEPIDAWLGALPAGWDSYPECRMKGAMVREMIAGCQIGPELVDRLPAPIARLVRAPPASSEWIPATLGVGLLTSVGKAARWDAARLRTMARASTERLSARIGLLLALTTPTVLMYASKLRWGLVYRGASLDWESRGPQALDLRIGYPAHLFSEFFALGQGWGFEPAIEATRVKALSLTMTSYSPTEAGYHISWG